VVVEDTLDWAIWFDQSKNRIVAQEMVGQLWVSTVFLGLDHNFGDGPPVLWETMVFGDDQMDRDRCSGSREQALAMHERMVKKVKGTLC
jgi:hypothetical protein